MRSGKFRTKALAWTLAWMLLVANHALPVNAEEAGQNAASAGEQLETSSVHDEPVNAGITEAQQNEENHAAGEIGMGMSVSDEEDAEDTETIEAQSKEASGDASVNEESTDELAPESENNLSASEDTVNEIPSGGIIQTAEELKNAIEKADDGAQLTLGADIAYDQSKLGTISVEKNIILDCADYKISENCPDEGNISIFFWG